LEARAVEMKKVYATLRVLIDVLEVLVRDSSSDGMGRLIMEEVNFPCTSVTIFFPKSSKPFLCSIYLFI